MQICNLPRIYIIQFYVDNKKFIQFQKTICGIETGCFSSHCYTPWCCVIVNY